MDAATEGNVDRLIQYLHASASRYSFKSEGHMVQLRFGMCDLEEMGFQIGESKGSD